MSATWGRDWRRLYRRPSSEWLALPLAVRGLGDELLRYVEDDGRVFVGKDPEQRVSVLGRRMGAHPSERKWLASALAKLVEDGFCAVEGSYLVVRNFVLAQTTVTGSAERMRRFRSGKQAEATAHAAPQTPQPHGLLPSTSATPTPQPHGLLKKTDGRQLMLSAVHDSIESVTVTSPKTRIDQTRIENTEEASPPARSDAVASLRSVRGGERVEPDDQVPADGTVARRVYQAIADDPAMRAIVRRPGRWSTASADPELYPALDVVSQVKRAIQWHRDNPSKRKKDGNRFLTGWLIREQERGGDRPSQTAGPVSTRPASSSSFAPRGGRPPESPYPYRMSPFAVAASGAPRSGR